jgi:hypothetical protein
VVKPETLADRALCIFDLLIYTIRGNVHETQRKIRYQHLKAEAIFQLPSELRRSFADHVCPLDLWPGNRLP